MSLLRSAWNWMDEAPRHRTGLRALQAAIGIALLFRISTEGMFARFLWGPHGIARDALRIYGPTVQSLHQRVFSTDAGTFLVLAVLALGAFGLVAGLSSRLWVCLALVGTTFLGARTAWLNDGGDNITSIVLTYMLLVVPPDRETRPRSLSVWLHNIGVVAITTQVLILYFTSGMAKARGDVWVDGTALYYISQVETFSHPAMREIFKHEIVTTLASHATMLHQVWLPVAFFSRLKLPWLCLGICFHLGVAGFMGLVAFSTVMVGLELFLITDSEYEQIGASLSRFRGRLSGMRNAVLRGRPGNQIEAGVPALAHAAQPEGEPIVVMERNVVKENI